MRIMRHVLLTLLLAFSAVYVAQSQIVADTFYIPTYPIPEIYYTDEAPELPDNVWNHKLKYFPDSIIDQIGSSCGQASGIFNCLTYSFNRVYDRKADSTNTFAPNHTFNLLSKYIGVSTFDSWNIVKSQGHPSRAEFEIANLNSEVNTSEFDDEYYLQYWMNGYDNYYKSFFNRISGYYSLNLNSDSDLIILKHFFNNQFEEGLNGGIAVFMTNPLTETTPDTIVHISDLALPRTHDFFYVLDTIFYHQQPTHQMTLVGYYKNEQVDFNGDGMITDSLDLNDDGVIDMHDNETTLWIALNSWGDHYAYFLLKYDVLKLFWNQQVFFPIPDTTYSPELTFKMRISHPRRGNLKISAGISSDLSSAKPEILINYPFFNFNGGPFCMKGIDTLPDPNLLEFGIDISDLKNYVPESGTYKIFLKIENNGLPEGELQYLSSLDYSKNTQHENIIVSSPEIIYSGTNYYSTILNLKSQDYNNNIWVTNPTITSNEINNKTEIDILVEGGQEPYSYYLIDETRYKVQLSQKEYPTDTGLTYVYVYSMPLKLNWMLPVADELWDSLNINNAGGITFYNEPIIQLEKRYPYELFSTNVNNPIFSPYSRYFFWNFIRRGMAIIINDSEIEIYHKDRINNHLYPDFYTKITKAGVIEITYGDSLPRSSICANIRSNVGDYYIPFADYKSENFNTVTFTPITPDSLFTIDSTGLLTMKAVSELGVYEVYVRVRDANGDEFTKRIEIDIIDENIIGNLYPNPTSDLIYSDIFLDQSQDCIIEVFNTVGQLMFKESRTLNLGINSLSLNVKSIPLSQGSYIYRVSIGGKSQSKSFVVTE